MKVFGVVLIVLVLLFVAMVLVGGPGHGPGRHLSGGDGAGGHAPASGVEHDAQRR